MNKLISILLILAFTLPVPAHVRADEASPTPDLGYVDFSKDVSFSSNAVKFAALEPEFVPVERRLIEEQKALAQKDPTKKSSWWKWALGILVVGGLAAAAGGGGGGGDTGGGTPTGTVTGTW